MTEELVTFPTAKLAREKGFLEGCRHGFEWYIFDGKDYGPNALDLPEVPAVTTYAPEERHYAGNKDLMRTLSLRKHMYDVFYNNEHLPPWLFARPTQDLLERWLREVHGIYCVVEPALSKHDRQDKWKFFLLTKFFVVPTLPIGQFDTYELAREAALLHALTLLP